MISIIDAQFDIEFESDGSALIKYTQDIPQSFIDSCREKYDTSRDARAKEFHQVASVPEILVDQWRAQGFDVMKEPVRATVARLKAENLDYFLTTAKKV